MSGRLRLRVITDGKAGDVAHVMGVAEAIARIRPTEIESIVVAPRLPWSLLMPWGPPDPRDAAAIAEPWPHIAIASGRRAVASLRALRRRWPDTFTVFLKDPRTGPGTADFIWVPAHDKLRGPNVLVTATAPHRLDADRLAKERAEPDARIADLPHPRLVVLLGGPSGGFDYTADAGQRLARRLLQAHADDFSLVVIPSRRTPQPFLSKLSDDLRAAAPVIWDPVTPNPYVNFLANADAIVAPADSHNMVSEALAIGVPVFVFHPDGPGAKLAAFVDELLRAGHLDRLEALPVAASFQTQQLSRNPIDATPVIVKRLLAVFDSKYQRTVRQK